MKKLALLILLSFSLGGLAQLPQVKGKLYFDLTPGIVINNIYTSIKTDEGVGLENRFNFNGRYYIEDGVNLGFNLGASNFVIDQPSTDTNQFTVESASASFNMGIMLIDNPRFFWETNASIGLRGLSYHIVDQYTGDAANLDFAGIRFGLESGINWMFLKWLGIHLDFNYSRSNLILSQMKYNEQVYETFGEVKVNETILGLDGIGINAGIRICVK